MQPVYLVPLPLQMCRTLRAPTAGRPRPQAPLLHQLAQYGGSTWAQNNCWPERNNPQFWCGQVSGPRCRIYLDLPHSRILHSRATVNLRLLLKLVSVLYGLEVCASFTPRHSSLQLLLLLFLVLFILHVL